MKKYNKTNECVGGCSSAIHSLIHDWIDSNLKEIYIKMRKLMTMTHAFHPKTDLDRLYVSTNSRGKTNDVNLRLS